MKKGKSETFGCSPLITLLNYWLCKDRENISAKVNHVITYHFNLFFSPPVQNNLLLHKVTAFRSQLLDLSSGIHSSESS